MLTPDEVRAILEPLVNPDKPKQDAAVDEVTQELVDVANTVAAPNSGVDIQGFYDWYHGIINNLLAREVMAGEGQEVDQTA